MRKRLPLIVRELLFLVIVYGILTEIIVLIVVKEWLFYSIGLMTGIILAIGMCIHMHISIEEAIDRGEAGAQKHISKTYALRSTVIFFVAGIIYYFKIGSIISLFIGIMGLKVAAYLQPFTHKYVQKYI
ncbi:hypothetical protein [Candidatus Galacturonibacter soehngenii]|uniref:ATP synthase subunit I n=1 Tax=Candidatus Galacturonatibacter soehngenii TaxID=2307010 RepID=A0A7V7UCF0_9FIRM|nr:hypothetical protein [Candidatus Galacturonibacter soehngenii]KAB1438589.1 hypothetical protein F7O84_13755 [Candidatus Galacturonibacter soehngenii]MBA4685621.1 hypothetical protein [Candidatus Galacturonibacter soehngenii]